MKTFTKPTLLAALLAAALLQPVWAADPTTDAARVKQQARDIPALQKAAVQAAGWAALTVRSAAHQLTVTVTGSTLGSLSEREAQASKIVAAIESGMEKKPAFAQVSVIHVNYVKPASRGLDFYQTPAGAFVQHKS